MLPAPDDHWRTLETMSEAAERLYPSCPQVLEPCPQALPECERGAVRACLAVVGRLGTMEFESIERALEQLRVACAAGDTNACIE